MEMILKLTTIVSTKTGLDVVTELGAYLNKKFVSSRVRFIRGVSLKNHKETSFFKACVPLHEAFNMASWNWFRSKQFRVGCKNRGKQLKTVDQPAIGTRFWMLSLEWDWLAYHRLHRSMTALHIESIKNCFKQSFFLLLSEMQDASSEVHGEEDGRKTSVADCLEEEKTDHERLKPRRVHAMSITIHSGLKTKILEAQSEASKDLKALTEWLRGLEITFGASEMMGNYFSCSPAIRFHINCIWWPGLKTRDIADTLEDVLRALGFKAEHQRRKKISDEDLIPMRLARHGVAVVTDNQEKDKIKAKTDKDRARNGRDRELSKSQSQSQQKSIPKKGKVKGGTDIEEMLNGPTRTHLMGQSSCQDRSTTSTFCLGPSTPPRSSPGPSGSAQSLGRQSAQFQALSSKDRDNGCNF
ncbi:hypothetical protein Tco_0356370 [Tanacetum coccineum]